MLLKLSTSSKINFWLSQIFQNLQNFPADLSDFKPTSNFCLVVIIHLPIHQYRHITNALKPHPNVCRHPHRPILLYALLMFPYFCPYLCFNPSPLEGLFYKIFKASRNCLGSVSSLHDCSQIYSLILSSFKKVASRNTATPASIFYPKRSQRSDCCLPTNPFVIVRY